MKYITTILLLVIGVFAQNTTYTSHNCIERVELPTGYIIKCHSDGSTGFIRQYVNNKRINHEYQYFPLSMGGGLFRDILWDDGEILQVEEYFPNGKKYYLLTLGIGEPLVQLVYRNMNNIASEIISQSINEYASNCPCPYNVDSQGNLCGDRSAYSRYGGYTPICYVTDITNTELEQHKNYIVSMWKSN